MFDIEFVCNILLNNNLWICLTMLIIHLYFENGISALSHIKRCKEWEKKIMFNFHHADYYIVQRILGKSSVRFNIAKAYI